MADPGVPPLGDDSLTPGAAPSPPAPACKGAPELQPPVLVISAASDEGKGGALTDSLPPPPRGCVKPSRATVTLAFLETRPELHWLIDNHYLLSGYRLPARPGAMAKTLFAWTNETLNVWTHLLGFIVFFGLFINTLCNGLVFAYISQQLNAATGASIPADTLEGDLWVFNSPRAQWPIMLFLLSAMTCLGFSAAFHQFWPVSPAAASLLARLDYTGISVLIAGSSVAVVWYGFACMPAAKWAYIGAAIATCSAAGTMSLLQRFQTPKWRLTRVAVFIGTGLVVGIPMAHMAAYGYVDHFAMYLICGMGATYIVGALLYGFRVPERKWPGRLDLVGASHQIFHVFVVAAALLNYGALRSQLFTAFNAPLC